MTCSTACPATIVVPGSTSRALTTPSTGLDEPRLRPQLADPRDIGQRPVAVAPRRGQLGGRRIDGRLRGIRFVSFGVGGFLADEPLRAQFGGAARARDGELRAALRLGELCLGGADGAGGAFCGELPAGDAILEIDRIEFGEQLPGLDDIALVDEHARDAARHRRPECIAAACLDRADAERTRDQRTLFDLGQRDLGRRERSLARRQPAEQQRAADAGGDQHRPCGRDAGSRLPPPAIAVEQQREQLPGAFASSRPRRRRARTG